MTKPAKTRKRPVAVRAAPVVLTLDEAELLRCYRVMDMRHRNENMVQMQRDAKLYPMVRRPPAPAPSGIRVVAVDGRLVVA